VELTWLQFEIEVLQDGWGLSSVGVAESDIPEPDARRHRPASQPRRLCRLLIAYGPSQMSAVQTSGATSRARSGYARASNNSSGGVVRAPVELPHSAIPNRMSI